MNPSTTSDWLTAGALARLSSSAERHIQKWAALEDVPTKTAKGHVLYNREATLIAIRLHQRPRRTGRPDETRGLQGLASHISRLSNRESCKDALVKVLFDKTSWLAEQIISNSPQGPEDVPEQCPQFTAPQCAWLAYHLGTALSQTWNLTSLER